MVDTFTFMIEIEMPIFRHRRLDRLGILHPELLENVLNVLRLAKKCSFFELLDLESKEEFEFAHHRHLESLCHNSTKLLTKSFISTTKYNVIDIYLAHK